METFWPLVIHMELRLQPVIPVAGDDEVATHHTFYFQLQVDENLSFNLYQLRGRQGSKAYRMAGTLTGMSTRSRATS